MTNSEREEEAFRGQLARTVTFWAMVVILVLCAIILIASGYRAAVSTSTDKDAYRDFIDTGKYVLAAVLPVVAGWVGSVMAFYFGKANFEAATKSASDLARQLTSQEKLATTKVESLGHSIQEATKFQIPSGADYKALTLKELKGVLTKINPPYQRLPVIDSTGCPLLILHYSVFNEFIVAQLENKKETDLGKLTLGELVKVNDWLLTKSFVTVQPGSTAAEAKNALEADPRCKDVVVTIDGSSKTAAIRWITNVHLLEAAKV